MTHIPNYHPLAARRRLFAIPGADGRLDPAAASVIAQLSVAEHNPGLTAMEARKRYTESRRRFLAPAEHVAQISKIRPAAAGTPPLTLFRPAGSEADTLLPGLVFLHGGGWTLGDLDIYEPLVRALANATGSAVIWVDYHLAPEYPFPTGLEEVWRAACWVQENAPSLGIDPRRIGIGGDSSGGNFAAVTALAARDGRIAFDPAYQLLLYPCLDLTAGLPSHELYAEGYLLTAKLYAWYRSNYLQDTDPTDWRASPLFASSFLDLAPAIILAAGFDPLRDEALTYAKRLKGFDVPVEVLSFPGQIHGFLNMGGTVPAARTAISRIGQAVRATLHSRFPV
ncbi:MAG: alpha/beta hydrolase [Parvibaculaceae bacterium]|nr:alpha/beta hydrolase [Parvibaculaceae bacterium]